MQEVNNELPEERKGGCVECNHPIIVPNVPTPLCEDCRQKFIKFPIPKWIKIFGGAICLIVLFSMYKLPRNLMTGVHLEKGKTAISEKRYLSAQRALEKFEKKVPDNLEANSYLLIAAYYNNDMATVSRLFKKLETATYYDNVLLAEVTEAISNSSKNFPGDSLNMILTAYHDDMRLIPEDSLQAFVKKHPDDIFSLMYMAGVAQQKEDYKKADTILTHLLSIDKNYIPALQAMSSIKRQENQFDESIECCDRLLKMNKEDVYAMASKSRTLLRQKKDAEALTLAKQSYEMNNTDAYATVSLLLAYHFTSNTKEKNALLQQISTSKDSSYKEIMPFANDVMSGKEPFRN